VGVLALVWLALVGEPPAAPLAEELRTVFAPPGGELPFGLRLVAVEVGPPARVRYAGTAGELVVVVHPASRAPDKVFFRGRGVALEVVSATLASDQQPVAVRALAELLAHRDPWWPWLAAEPAKGPGDPAMGELGAAERASSLGDSEAALASASRAVAQAPGEYGLVLRASRALHRVGLREPGRQVAASLGRRLLLAIDAHTKRGEDAHHLHDLRAEQAVLAGELDAARPFLVSLARSPRACRVAEVLGAARDAAEIAWARARFDEIRPSLPARCDHAVALAVELAVDAEDFAGASKLLAEAVPSRVASGPLQLARARLAIREDRLELAAEAAAIALRLGRGEADEALALLLWLRDAMPPGNGTWRTLLDERRSRPDAPPAARALAAQAQGRLSEAEAALREAWRASPYDLGTLLAEAELASARNDADLARRAREAIARRLGWRGAKPETPAAPPHQLPDESPARPPEPPWLLFILTAALLAATPFLLDRSPPAR
jgi:hypothetical protein